VARHSLDGQSGNSKTQISNNKWFDKLTTLSQVEGQITMTEIQNYKQEHGLKERTFHSMFWSLDIVI